MALGSLVLIAALSLAATAQEAAKPAPQAPPAEQKRAPEQGPGQAKPAEKQKTPEERAAEEAEAALQKAVRQAGTDRVALVRNLQEYLAKYPASPRRQDLYRAIVETSAQLKDRETAIRYANLYLAAEPDDVSMLLFAIGQLEEREDPQELDRALGYAERVIARVTKFVSEPRPPRLSPGDWEAEQKRLLMSGYLLRGRLFQKRKQYDRAREDLARSFDILRSPQAGEKLGELAELVGDADKAIDYYLMAFAAPDDYGAPVDHEVLRRKMGNVYRLKHGSEAGLGDAVLATYDRMVAEANARKTAEAPAARNAGRQNVYDFELRKLEGGTLKLGQFSGKVLVLSFWATWCKTCQALAPFFEQVVDRFRADPEVIFLAVNAQEDVELIKTFIERERWKTPVVFDDGLAAFYRVEGLPVVMVLDRKGRAAYRASGFTPTEFVPTLTRKIEEARAAQ